MRTATLRACLPRAASHGFTLMEVLVAMAIGSVVFGAGMTAIVSLQKSYAATEQYAVNLADQTRLMDYLTLDLRRATAASMTTDGTGKTNGLTLTMPNYYAATTPPTPNTPRIYVQAAYYGAAPASGGAKVIYRQRPSFNDPKLGPLLSTVTRQEAGGVEASVASGMDAFPEISFDAANGTPGGSFATAQRARIKIVFRPRFQTASSPSSNTIVLHGLTFLRNNDTQKD